MNSLTLAAGDTIKLGVIGFSVGNGHPYSWSAICNGYDKEKIRNNEFPVIANYLEQQSWPGDAIKNAQVIAIYCEDRCRAKNIADATLIDHVSPSVDDLLKRCDGILLARDDLGERRALLKYLIASGKAIYVDKPFAESSDEARELFAMQRYPQQIFTTSALRYAEDILLNDRERREIGEVVSIYATTPKAWLTYAVHLLEPIVAQWPTATIQKRLRVAVQNTVHLTFQLDNIHVVVSSLGCCTKPITIEYQGRDKVVVKTFTNAFSCFKNALEHAIQQWVGNELSISREQTKTICRLIDMGGSP